MNSDKKTPKQTEAIFTAIVKAAVKGNPKPKKYKMKIIPNESFTINKDGKFSDFIWHCPLPAQYGPVKNIKTKELSTKMANTPDEALTIAIEMNDGGIYA